MQERNMEIYDRRDMMASIYKTNSLLSVLCVMMFTSVVNGLALKTYYVPGDQCGYVVTNGDQFKVVTRQVQHEGEPSKTSYMANVSCSITFRTDPTKKLFLRVSNFEVAGSRYCTKDGLYLYDGGNEGTDPLLSANEHALCGTTLSLPNYFTSTGSEVVLKFVTDDADNFYRGFTVLITPFDMPDNCDGFKCLLKGRCITRDAACNKESQCQDGSDEPPNCHLRNTGVRSSCSWSQNSLLAFSSAVLWMSTIIRTAISP